MARARNLRTGPAVFDLEYSVADGGVDVRLEARAGALSSGEQKGMVVTFHAEVGSTRTVTVLVGAGGASTAGRPGGGSDAGDRGDRDPRRGGPESGLGGPASDPGGPASGTDLEDPA